MHAVDLIASALRPEQMEPLPGVAIPGICSVTGQNTLTIASKHLWSGNFCDTNLLTCPQSDRVGVNAWYAMQFGEAGTNAETGEFNKRRKKPEYMSCWWCDGIVFREMRKADIRALILYGTDAKQWAGWVTTSYKKHGSLRAPVNNSRFGAWGFDDVVVRAGDIDAVLAMWRVLRGAQNIGIGRTGIESLEIPVNILSKVGIAACVKFCAWARPLYLAPLYQFLTYLLPSQDELKAGYTDEFLPN